VLVLPCIDRFILTLNNSPVWMLNRSDCQSSGGKLAASKRRAGALASGPACCSCLEAAVALPIPDTAASTIRHRQAVGASILSFIGHATLTVMNACAHVPWQTGDMSSCMQETYAPQLLSRMACYTGSRKQTVCVKEVNREDRHLKHGCCCGHHREDAGRDGAYELNVFTRYSCALCPEGGASQAP
jgi:hypothetical protein